MAEPKHSIWSLEPLSPGVYDFVMADPPWRFKLRSQKNLLKSPQGKYACMSLAEIQALPVADLIGPGGGLLWLWATAPMLPLQIETLERWGFTYKTMGVWHKRTKRGKTAFGTGYRLRSASEPFLIGAIGNPQSGRGVRNLIEGVVRQHSRKPEEAYAAAEAMMPVARRAELFSRTDRPGWDTWGDQTGTWQTEDSVFDALDRHPT